MKNLLLSLTTLPAFWRHYPLLGRGGAGRWPIALVLLLLGQLGLATSWATNFVADVEIPRQWVKKVPQINAYIDYGEWLGAKVTPIIGGTLRTMNDETHLYIAVDFTSDTHDDDASDSFELLFDADRNKARTPNVDLHYYLGANNQLARGVFLTPTTSGQFKVAALSEAKRGFGNPWFSAATTHRFYEIRLGLAELGVDLKNWSLSAGVMPSVRVTLALHSQSPYYHLVQPDPAVPLNFKQTFRIGLAAFPSTNFPASDRLFAGVGLVPVSNIGLEGYANQVSGLYTSGKDAPFGGNLNLFAKWSTLGAYNAKRYRIWYAKDGGAEQPLRQSWTNFKNIGGVWTPQTITYDANDSYPVPPSWEASYWYVPDLVMAWQSSQFADGTYTLRMQLLAADGTTEVGKSITLAKRSLTLFVVNTPPTAHINYVAYDGTTNVCECGIVTQGDAPRSFKFNVSVNDPNGALKGYRLYTLFGKGQSADILPWESYDPGHVVASKRWYGTMNDTVPDAAGQWRAAKSCAYTFILQAFSRVQNGYGEIFPSGVSDHVSLTVLLGTGAGDIDCPGASR